MLREAWHTARVGGDLAPALPAIDSPLPRHLQVAKPHFVTDAHASEEPARDRSTFIVRPYHGSILAEAKGRLGRERGMHIEFGGPHRDSIQSIFGGRQLPICRTLGGAERRRIHATSRPACGTAGVTCSPSSLMYAFTSVRTPMSPGM